MILEPTSLSVYQLIQFGLIRDFLAFSLEEVVNVVSEQIIRDYVCF